MTNGPEMQDDHRMIEYKGHTGRVLVEPDAMVIVRDTFASKVNYAGVDPWCIPLQAITGVYLEPATRFKPGKIQILVGPAPASNRHAAAVDTVLFTYAQREQFGQLDDWLRAVARVNADTGVDSTTTPMAPPPSSKGLDDRRQARLEKLRGPAEPGVIFKGRSHDDGRNATVTLYSDRIERVKDRKLTSLSSAKQDVEVTPIRAITSVQAKKDNMLWTKVTVYASGNNIDFRLGHADAHLFRDAITELVLHPAQTVASPMPQAAAPDVMDQLKKLGELRDDGVLTPEEFETKKADLLNRI